MNTAVAITRMPPKAISESATRGRLCDLRSAVASDSGFITAIRIRANSPPTRKALRVERRVLGTQPHGDHQCGEAERHQHQRGNRRRSSLPSQPKLKSNGAATSNFWRTVRLRVRMRQRWIIARRPWPPAGDGARRGRQSRGNRPASGQGPRRKTLASSIRILRRPRQYTPLRPTGGGPQVATIDRGQGCDCALSSMYSPQA